MRSFSEFLGIALLILLGNGVVAAVSFKRMSANQPGKYVLVAFAWGLAVFLGALVSSSLNGYGHLNPALTLMDIIVSSKKEVIIDNSIYTLAVAAFNVSYTRAYIIVFFVFLMFQLSGAMFGQIVLNFINFKFLKDKENDIFTIRNMHCTTPVYKNKEDKATIFNFAYELVGTMVLLGVILALGSNVFGNIQLGKLEGVAVFFLVSAIGMSLGAATGYAINPARDFGPRIIYWLTIKKFRKDDVVAKFANWNYAWVPVLAPLVAGIIVGIFGIIK
ncbi:aquaporin family protein [Mycoplasma sp. E35C]|nr:aquaporin family protein [Mycoplasma sp. E35C]